MSQCTDIACTPTQREQEWTYRPDTDIISTPRGYEIVADVPGASADAIDVTFEDGILSLEVGVTDRYDETAEFARREFGVGNYHVRFRLEDDVDVAGITAGYEAGVLRVQLPTASDGRRRIPVT